MNRGIVRRKRGEKDRGRGKDWGRADERRERKRIQTEVFLREWREYLSLSS